MKVLEKSVGKHISYSLDGAVLSFEDNRLVIDLEKEQRGYGRTLDISLDENGRLVTGIAQWYAAQIYIPEQKFNVQENGIVDAMGFRQITKTKQHLDLDNVTLTLWAMEENYGRL